MHILNVSSHTTHQSLCSLSVSIPPASLRPPTLVPFLPRQYNVALPPAILSRFDLVHVMVDSPDALSDFSVASHIVNVHRSQDAALQPEFSSLQLQKYIRYARSIKPEVGRHTAAVSAVCNMAMTVSMSSLPTLCSLHRVVVPVFPETAILQPCPLSCSPHLPSTLPRSQTRPRPSWWRRTCPSGGGTRRQAVGPPTESRCASWRPLSGCQRLLPASTARPRWVLLRLVP